MSRLTFNSGYFFLALLIFFLELLIALFVHDDFIRPYVGDFLVVILIYCFLKSFLAIPPLKAAFCVLLFSYAVETLQYFHFVNRIGLGDVRIARIVIGTSFAWADFIAYTAGIIVVLYIEYRQVINKKLQNINMVNK